MRKFQHPVLVAITLVVLCVGSFVLFWSRQGLAASTTTVTQLTTTGAESIAPSGQVIICLNITGVGSSNYKQYNVSGVQGGTNSAIPFRYYSSGCPQNCLHPIDTSQSQTIYSCLVPLASIPAKSDLTVKNCSSNGALALLFANGTAKLKSVKYGKYDIFVYAIIGNAPAQETYSGQKLLTVNSPNNSTSIQLSSNPGGILPTSCPSGDTGLPPNCQAPSSGGPGIPTCQATGGALSWLTCALIDGIQGVESHIENVVQGALKTGTIDFNSADCKSGATSQNYTACVYNVWSDFRVYGNIVLVIALLVIVFGEAIGGGLIDAYTAKKMLPRILVAAILINLSIYIVAALEDIVNILGSGLYDIISAPFKNSGTFHINISGTGGNLFGSISTAGLLGGLAAGAVLWKTGGLGDALGFLALMVGLPALLAVIGVLLTIFFRHLKGEWYKE